MIYYCHDEHQLTQYSYLVNRENEYNVKTESKTKEIPSHYPNDMLFDSRST